MYKKQGDIAEAILQAYEEKKLNSFIRSQFTAAALAGLVKHGESSDALIGRIVLRKNTMRKLYLKQSE